MSRPSRFGPENQGYTTDSFDLYVGIDSTTTNNQFIGSGRFWTLNSTTTGSGVNLVEGTSTERLISQSNHQIV